MFSSQPVAARLCNALNKFIEFQILMTTSTPAKPTSDAARFGTIAGVFVPNILTILGIILFLRTGWVVGQAGLIGALVIVALANSISLLTGLSLSAIATNMRVRAGGNYYLISRSLGLEVGGAIGIPLYLSQAISVAFYIIGFTEALQSIAFFATIDARLIAAFVAAVFGVVAYIGADFALRIQYFILGVLVLALLSFFTGGWGNFMSPSLEANYTSDVTFWVVFAVFFPAVTGIEVGTSLSGDLKDPSRSIPRGTIASILVTAVIYFAAVIWFALNRSPEDLINDTLAMQGVATVPFLILAGVWASTLSSALGSVLAAPRTLQAIARDYVVPRWLAGQLGSPTEPRVAVLMTAAIAFGVIMMGDLDFVAPIISMFFLNTYGMVNLAAAIERLVGNPSYRPRFKIPWQVSLLGALGCYGAMYLINPLATFIAIVISYGFFLLLERRQIRRTWGDVRNGIWFALSRYALLRLEVQRWHIKNWRPNIIVFTGQPHNRRQLVEVSEWLSLGRGIVTFFQFITGQDNPQKAHQLRITARRHIRKFIDERGLKAFAEAEIAPDFRQGALMVAQAHGIGSLQANTILMGWSRTPEGRATQIALMHDLVAFRKSVLFLKNDPENGFGEHKSINVWWKGKGGNADLMLLLVHLIGHHRSWRNATTRLLRVVDTPEAVESTRTHMQELLNTVRVDAKPVIIVRSDPSQRLVDLIAEKGLTADLTLVGMQLPLLEDVEAYSQRLDRLTDAAGTVLLVRNAERDEDLLLAEESS
jgi:amino acid transporter